MAGTLSSAQQSSWQQGNIWRSSTWATAPARAPQTMRCMGVMRSRSATTSSFMRSLKVSLMAVSGAILITFVPFPLKKALTVPAGTAEEIAQGQDMPWAAVKGIGMCTWLTQSGRAEVPDYRLALPALPQFNTLSPADASSTASCSCKQNPQALQHKQAWKSSIINFAGLLQTERAPNLLRPSCPSLHAQ